MHKCMRVCSVTSVVSDSCELYSPPGSSGHGILQARILEWAAIPFSSGWIFLTQGLNLSLLHYRWIFFFFFFCHLSHKRHLRCTNGYNLIHIATYPHSVPNPPPHSKLDQLFPFIVVASHVPSGLLPRGSAATSHCHCWD